MRVVCVSDTHQRHIPVPDGDVLIHAGDLTNCGCTDEVKRAADWLNSLPHPHKVVICGNHDWLFQAQPEKARAILNSGQITYLQDSETTIEGLRFYGMPWQPEFCGWAFNLPRGGEELKARCDAIPDGIDVLISHGPPYSIGDRVTAMPLGCTHLANRVAAIRPRLHVFGHIHPGYGGWKHESTTFLNASICRDDGQGLNAPIVVDLT